VIVRIANEAQYRLDDGHHAKLDELDDAVVAAVDAGDRDGFQSAFSTLLEFVRTQGESVSDDDLTASEYILPPADLTFDEAGEEFSGEGLIPDPVP
jgi:PspAA-like protein